MGTRLTTGQSTKCFQYVVKKIMWLFKPWTSSIDIVDLQLKRCLTNPSPIYSFLDQNWIRIYLLMFSLKLGYRIQLNVGTGWKFFLKKKSLLSCWYSQVTRNYPLSFLVFFWIIPLDTPDDPRQLIYRYKHQFQYNEKTLTWQYNFHNGTIMKAQPQV